MQKNSVGEPFSVSLYSGTEKVRIRRGWEVSRFSVENFSPHGAEGIRRMHPLVFHSFRVSKKFG